MGSTLGYRKGIGEHGRQRRGYYTLFAFDFMCLRFYVLLLFIGSFFLSFSLFLFHIFPILSLSSSPFTYLSRPVDQIVRCRLLLFYFIFFFSFLFISFLSLFVLDGPLVAH